ncbi:hypothetical protein H7J07_05440 [Mycobacterium koreense]|uniref:Uncharacterized protein n=1 Tax=Mycolicibacillus koreensis TaxID=1069220 RepID=A0A7I7SBG0_9MYCO|nr:hypothetical protein [Mycolicibacillus koreensis]MCV7247668.1 hypothetical protein [Mycolicibacillus koreensis]OSC23265.1 hypothetical protein B8W67_19890 [Mycolicibacillus koreensis]BBY54053.1 hypothetical protein MKOR_13040 [Mycolicibacillus koreensis]
MDVTGGLAAEAADVTEMCRQLTGDLGPALVAALANVRNRHLPAAWSAADGPHPPPEAADRLRAAHRVWALISAVEGGDITRAWFIGANPHLGGESPVMRLRSGDVAAVAAAAEAFIADIHD